MTERLHFHFSLSCIEKEMATHSSVLAWRIPETGEPGGLPSMGSHRVRHDWSDLAAAGAKLRCACIISHFSCVRLCATLWTIAHQAPLSMGFSRQEYWSGLPCPPRGDLPDPGIKPTSLVSCIGRCVVYHQRHLRCPEYNWAHVIIFNKQFLILTNSFLNVSMNTFTNY